MSLSKVAQDYVYEQIDKSLIRFMGKSKKPSEICKKYSVMSEDDILKEIKEIKDARVASIRSTISKAQEELSKLGE